MSKQNKVINSILIFMFIFDISLKNIPTFLSSRKIVMLILAFEAIFGSIKIYRNDNNRVISYGIINIFILIYVVIISVFQGTIGHEYSILPRYIFFLIYTIFGSILLINKFSDEYDFYECIINAMWLQSFIVILTFFSPQFKLLLTRFFNDEGNISFMRTDRSTGLGAEGAYLTLLLFLGVFSCNYIIITKRLNFKYLISQLLFLTAMFVSGRTGILCSLIIIIYTIGYLVIKENLLRNAFKIAGCFCGGVFVGLIIIKRIMTEKQFNRLFSRIGTMITNIGDDDSINKLSEMKIPKMCNDLIIGTGIFRGYTNDGFYVWNDRGYVQIYAALGIVMSLLFYIALIAMIYRFLDDKIFFGDVANKKLYIIYTVMLFIVEVKEPFIIRGIMPLYIIVSICLYHRRLLNEQKN